MNTKSYWQQLLFIGVITLSLAVTTTASADYKPPANPSRPKGPIGSNSTRNVECIGKAQTNLTPLAPLSHFRQTVSSQPTFAWFVPNIEPHPIEFNLYEYGVSGKGKLIKRIELQSSPGIMKLSLAKEQYNLSVGQKYLWQIALLCNSDRHLSENLVAEAVIEVVAMPSRLTSELEQTKEPQKRAQLYAEAGLWYDALSEALLDPKNKAFTLKLLAQLSKSEAEAAKTSQDMLKKKLRQHVIQLWQVIDIERQGQ